MAVSPSLGDWAAWLLSASVGRAQAVIVLVGAIVLAGGWFAASTAQAKIRSEEQLIYSGTEIRDAIASYWFAAPPGKRELPRGMSDLLDDRRDGEPRRHLARPVSDPVTGAGDWVVEWTADHRMIGVHSASDGSPVGRHDFDPDAIRIDGTKHYSQWVFRFDPGRFAPAEPSVARAADRPARNSAKPVDTDGTVQLRGSTQLSMPPRATAAAVVAAQSGGARALRDAHGVVHVPPITADGTGAGVRIAPTRRLGRFESAESSTTARPGDPRASESRRGVLPRLASADAESAQGPFVAQVTASPSERPLPSPEASADRTRNRPPDWMLPPRLDAHMAGLDARGNSEARAPSRNPTATVTASPPRSRDNSPASDANPAAAASGRTAGEPSSDATVDVTRLRPSLRLGVPSSSTGAADAPSVAAPSAIEELPSAATVSPNAGPPRAVATEALTQSLDWCDTLDATWRRTCAALEGNAGAAAAAACRSRAGARVAACREGRTQAGQGPEGEGLRGTTREPAVAGAAWSTGEPRERPFAAESSASPAFDGESLVLTNADLPAAAPASTIEPDAGMSGRDAASDGDRPVGRGRKRGPDPARTAAMSSGPGGDAQVPPDDTESSSGRYALPVPGGGLPPPGGRSNRQASRSDDLTSGVAAGVMAPSGPPSHDPTAQPRALPEPSGDPPISAFMESPEPQVETNAPGPAEIGHRTRE